MAESADDEPMEEVREREDASESSGSEEEPDVNVEELEAAVRRNPDDYEAHQQYLAALRKKAQLDKLRRAREAMASLFPLSAKMWQEWANDEARLLSGEGDISSVESIYERGLHDYLSVPLWLDYLHFVEERDASVASCSSEGLTKMRALFERAITAAGLHFAEGFRIWNAYREFEQAVLVAMAEHEEKEKKDQTGRVRSLFHRQLAIPLGNHALTLKEYMEWEGEQGKSMTGPEHLDANVANAYKKAEAACIEYKPFEDNIEAGRPVDADLLQHYLHYISFEQGKGNSDPARVQVLLERAVTVFPITADVWLKYTSYLDQKLKVSSVCKSVYARAVRNCPWVEELWRKYILSLERSNSSDDEISAVFEQSLQKGFQTPDEYLDIFLTRVDGLRRQKASADRLRGAFRRAAEFLATYFPEFVDRSLQLHGYWARTEVRLCKDIEAARAVWEGLTKAAGWMTEVWQGYIAMELESGNLHKVRTLYKRCYSRKLEGNGTETICQAWLQFEREYGSLNDFDVACAKAGQRLEEIRSMQAVQDAKDPAKDQRKSKAHVDEGQTSKRKRSKDVKEEKKRQKMNPKGDSEKPPEGLDEPEKPDEVGHEKQTPAKFRQKVVHTDELTAFVSNIPLEVTDKDLREFFAPCGGLKEVRLLKDRFTKRSRGLAYIDFETEENLATAIDKNKSKLRGRRISVARSNPKPKSQGGENPRTEGKRIVKPLGWVASQGPAAAPEPGSPKSNNDFRKMLLKGE